MSDDRKQEMVDRILEEVLFERGLYDAVANGAKYEVLPIDAFDTSSPRVSEELSKKALETQCAKDGHTLLYRISYGNYAVIMSTKGDKIAIEPEDADGWYC